MEAMPSSNLKPEDDTVTLDANKIYRTTYMFSATMPPPVERLARKYMRKPIVINIGRAGQATDNVTQRVLVRGGGVGRGALESDDRACGQIHVSLAYHMLLNKLSLLDNLCIP